VDYDAADILEAIKRQVASGGYQPDYLYGDGHASKRIVEVLSSHEPRLQKRWFVSNDSSRINKIIRDKLAAS
jgi:UDP-N-acetylglucosamine 2-epimerase